MRINRLTQAVRFVRVSRLLLWTIWVIYNERRRVLRARERGDLDAQPNIERLIDVLVEFRKTAVQLGVLMIKLGQFLSSRADLLPQRALDVLSSLQDEVPPAPFSHVQTVIERELGQPIETLFTSIERDASAAASLGQVHKAVLASTGQAVAVKVQRPQIDRLVAMDLSTIRFVIWVISRFVDTEEFIDLRAFYREFRRTIYEEIDYVQEGANGRRFSEIFAGRPGIVIPAIVQASKRVLILEWIDGIKVNDYASLEARGISRFEVARRTVEAYFYQFFEIGFFHADPHPGNIFVLPDATVADGGPTVAFVDFGMVGSLTRIAKQSLRDLFVGFVISDAHTIVNSLHRLGFIGQGANLTTIERGVALLMQQYHGLTLGEVRDLNVSAVAHEIEDLFYSQPFHVPAQFAFAGRAVGTLSGLATGLSPEFNLVAVAIPYAQRFLGVSREGATEQVQQILTQAATAGRTLLTLPTTLERVLSRIEAGQLEVRMSENGRNGRRRRGRPARSDGGGSTLTSAAVIASSLAAGTILLLNQAVVPGWFCLALAGVGAATLLFRR